MRWSDYVAVTAGLLLVSWLRTIWAPSADVVTAGAIVLLLTGGVIRQRLRARRFARLAHLEPPELAAAIADMEPADAALARLGFEISTSPERLEQLPRERIFPYRAGSQSLHEYLFWLSLLIAGACLVPVALGRVQDPAAAVVWIALAGIMLLASSGYRAIARELRAVIRVTPEGISLEGTVSEDVHLSWLEIAWAHAIRLPHGVYRAVVIGARSGKRLNIDTQLPHFEEVLELVVARVAAARGAS